MRWIACFALLCCYVNSHAAWSPDAAGLAALQERTEARWQRLHQDGKPKPHADTREFMAFALDAMASGGDALRVQQALEIVRAQQDQDPASKSYGNIRWYLDDTRVVDRNGVEFVLRHANLLWLLYRDRLTPAQRAPLQATLELARVGITQHAVPVSYTNIFLMKAWNLIALGEGLDDAALAAQGNRMLRDWLDFTARAGISEFLSPTYYAVDLECLALIRNLARDADTRALAQRGLDAIWSDTALNWYAPAGRLGGVHSRDYNRLFNTGDLNMLVARAGWPSAGMRRPDPGPYGFYSWSAPSPAAAQWLQAPLPRMLTSRWGELPQQRHWHYQAPDFSVASAEAGYHNMDTAPIAVNLGSGEDAPVISYTMDGRSDYYGTDRSLESGSGHLKSLHLRPFLSSVQRGPEVLFLAHGGLETVAHHTLESSLILPADAQYWLDDRPLKLYTRRSAWSIEPAANGRTTRFEVLATPEGSRAVLDDTDSKAGIGIARVFAVEAGRDYRLRARLAGGEVSLYLNFYDAQDKLIGGERIQRVTASPQAREVSFSQQAPAAAVRCRAWLYSPIATQTRIELSDLAFEQVAASGNTKLGAYDFEPFQAQTITVPTGATLVMQRGTAALALRLLAALDTEGKPLALTLYNDGLAHNALRLSVRHGDNQTRGKKGSFAMWLRAAGGLDEAAAQAFRTQAAAQRLRFSLQDGVAEAVAAPAGEGEALRLRADLTRGQRLLREGGEGADTAGVRTLNTQPIGF